MNKAVKKLYEEWEKIDKIRVFEVEVIDKRTEEKEYLIFDISFEKHSLIARHEPLFKYQLKSKKIAYIKLTVDPFFSLTENLELLYECCIYAIIESDFYELTE